MKDRQLEQLRRDIEWEKASRPPPFGRVDQDGHYIPQWKVDELDAAAEAKKTPEQKAKDAARKAKQAELAAHRAAEISWIRKEIAKLEQPPREEVAKPELPPEWQEAQAKIKAAIEAVKDRKQAQALREKAERALQRSREAVAREAQYEAARAERQARYEEGRRQQLKNSILAVLRSVFPHLVTLERLMVAIGCNDKDLVMSCTEELIQQGLLARQTEQAE